MRRVLSIVAAVTLHAACSSKSPSPPHGPTVVTSVARDAGAPPARSTVDVELLRTISILATQQAPTTEALAQSKAAIDAGSLTLDAYIDSQLARPEFAKKVAPQIILRGFYSLTPRGIPAGWTLYKTDGAEPIYYLNNPCKKEKTVSVHPWWDLASTVSVCADSYLPDKWIADSHKGEAGIQCLSQYGPDRGCGCGPNMLRCYPSRDVFDQTVTSHRAETANTIAYLVGQSKPLEEMFLSNGTFRDANVERLYREEAMEFRRDHDSDKWLADLKSWPAEGKWAPRSELSAGQHAGILTDRLVLHFFPDRRQRMTILYDLLWCASADSAGATPEQITKLAGVKNVSFQLKQDGWKELAGRPICTNCHARLDYGIQFFKALDNGDIAETWNPKLAATGKGPLYGSNIDDPRGEDELTPAGFARMATAQPEFRRCMARDFMEYVLGGRSDNDHVSQLEAKIQPNKTTAIDLARAALQVLAKEWSSRDIEPAHTASTVAISDRVQLPAATKQAISDRCLDCHDGTDTDLPVLSGADLSRESAVSVLNAVAFGAMPKNQPMTSADRRVFLTPIIDSLWSGADADAAHDYFTRRMTALPIYRPEVAFELIHAHAHGKGSAWRMMETSVRSDDQQATPGIFAIMGLETIQSCRDTNTKREDIDRCINDTLRVEDIVPGLARWTRPAPSAPSK